MSLNHMGKTWDQKVSALQSLKQRCREWVLVIEVWVLV